MKTIDMDGPEIRAIEDGPGMGDRLIPENPAERAVLRELIERAISQVKPRIYAPGLEDDPKGREASLSLRSDLEDEAAWQDGYLAGYLVVTRPVDIPTLDNMEVVPARLFTTYNPYTTPPYQIKVWWEIKAGAYTDNRVQSNYCPQPPILSVPGEEGDARGT